MNYKRQPYLVLHERKYLARKIVISRRNENFPFVTIMNIECVHIQNIKIHSYVRGTKTLIGNGAAPRHVLEHLNTKWKKV